MKTHKPRESHANKSAFRMQSFRDFVFHVARVQVYRREALRWQGVNARHYLTWLSLWCEGMAALGHDRATLDVRA